jgi:hypothetical protein
VLSAGSSPRHPRLYREVTWRGADKGPETGPALRRGRFVGGGEWSLAERRGVGDNDESESLLTRSRWEGVDGCQKERASGRRYVLYRDDVSDR